MPLGFGGTYRGQVPPSVPHLTACSGRCTPPGTPGEVICQGGGILISHFHYGSFYSCPTYSLFSFWLCWLLCRLFSSCGKQGLLSCCGARALEFLGFSSCGTPSVVAGLISLQYVGSSRIRDQTRVVCIGSWILYN